MPIPSASRLLLKLPPRFLGVGIWLLIFGGSCAVLGYLYTQAAGQQKAMLEKMIGELSHSASLLIDMQLHEQLLEPTQQGSPAYTKALAPLVRFHRNLPAAQYVYTMRVTPDDRLFFILDTAEDADIRSSQEALGRSIVPSPLMEPYELPYSPTENAALLTLLRSGRTFVDKSPFTDEYGMFVTAHAPLFDTAGTFSGFIGIDYNIDQYERDLAVIRNYGLLSLLLALLVSAGLARLMLQLRQQALDNLRETALARQRAEQANQAKSELLAIATHDLKNPLSAISSMAELLINLKNTHQVLPTQEIACLQNIRESSRHMFALVRRILDNEKLESGMLALEKTTVDLTTLCRGVIAANMRAAERKQLHIVANLPESLMVDADPDHLLEAFDNYLNNAVKYSSPGQTIRLSLQRLADLNMAEFAVEDEGPGLTDDDMQKAFGRFRRLSARPTNGEHSTGLGLSIVKLVLELHGGSVGCESPPGKGARFWARLPLQSAM